MEMQVCSWLLSGLWYSCTLSAENCQKLLSVVRSPQTDLDPLGNLPSAQQQGCSAGEGFEAKEQLVL